MRNYIYVFVLAILFSQSVQAEDVEPVSLDDMKMFAPIAGGYAMEKKCRFGTDEKFDDFTLSKKAIYKSL